MAQPTATDSKSAGAGGPSSPSYLLDFAVGGGAQTGAGGSTVEGPGPNGGAGSLLDGDLSADGGRGGGSTGLTPEVIKLQRENELLQKKVRWGWGGLCILCVSYDEEEEVIMVFVDAIL